MPIYQYILRRLALSVPLIFGVTLIAFIISHAVPADPITANLGQKAMSDPEIVAAFRAEWGLDKPITEQYLIYLKNLLRGDLGRSIKSRRAVVEDLRAYLPATIELATTAILFGATIGLILGLTSALMRNSWIDHVARIISLLGVSLPVFWLALLALYLFYAELGWAAGPGRLDAGMAATAARHRPLHGGCHFGRPVGCLSQCSLASDPAGAGAGQLHHRADHARYALGAAGGAGRGLHSHGALPRGCGPTGSSRATPSAMP